MKLSLSKAKKYVSVKTKNINEYLAVKITQYFSTMLTFYIFFIWGLLAFVPRLYPYKDMILLISSAWVQLWALPALAIGNAFLNRESETRAKQDHEVLKQEFDIVKQELEILKQTKELEFEILHELRTHMKGNSDGSSGREA